MPLPDFSKTGLLGGMVAAQEDQRTREKHEALMDKASLDIKAKGLEIEDYEAETGARRAEYKEREATAGAKERLVPEMEAAERAKLDKERTKSIIDKKAYELEHDVRSVFDITPDNYDEKIGQLDTDTRQRLGLTGRGWEHDGPAISATRSSAINNIDHLRDRDLLKVRLLAKQATDDNSRRRLQGEMRDLNRTTFALNQMALKENPVFKGLSSDSQKRFSSDFNQMYQSILNRMTMAYEANETDQKPDGMIARKLALDIMSSAVAPSESWNPFAGDEYDPQLATMLYAQQFGQPYARDPIMDEVAEEHFATAGAETTTPSQEAPNNATDLVGANQDLIANLRSQYALEPYSDYQVLQIAKNEGFEVVGMDEQTATPATPSTPKAKTEGEKLVSNIKKGQKLAAVVEEEMEDWMDENGNLEAGRKQIDRWIKKLRPGQESGRVKKLIKRLERARKSARSN